MCDYSLNAVKTRPADVDDRLTIRMFGWSTRGLPRLKTGAWQFAYYQEQNCPSRKRLGKYIPGRGPRRPSATRRRSFVRSIKAIRRFITMPSNSPMVGSSW